MHIITIKNIINARMRVYINLELFIKNINACKSKCVCAFNKTSLVNNFRFQYKFHTRAYIYIYCNYYAIHINIYA